MLSVAKTFARYGRHRACQRLLVAAESRCERAVWMRAKIEIADIAGTQSDALASWQEILELEPLAIDAHQQVARLLHQRCGVDTAREHLAKYVDRYPTSYALRALQIEWLKDTPADAEAAISQLLLQRPRDAWACRELAVSLGAQGKWTAAAEVVTRARLLEPNSPVTDLLQAEVAFARGNLKEAKEACRSAVQSSVEYPPAIHALLSLCQDEGQRRQEIEFVRDQFYRQSARSGESVFAFFAAAERTLDDRELLQTVGELRHRRLDVWQLWAVNIRCLMKTDNVEHATNLSEQMIDRFPLHSAGWLQLAEILGDF
jgi:predicted Zn-dependent protease